MKKIASFLVAAVLSLSALPAQASMAAIDLDPSGVFYKALGTMPADGYDAVLHSSSSGTFPGSAINATFSGQLLNNTMVTFDYSLSSPTGPLGSFYSVVSSVGSLDSNEFRVTAFPGMDTGVVHGDLAGAVVLASAGLDLSLSHGITTLTNLTGGTIQFTSQIVSLMMGPSAFLNVHASVSQVPLPAALPLFGLGIASLAGYRAKKKKDAAKA